MRCYALLLGFVVALTPATAAGKAHKTVAFGVGVHASFHRGDAVTDDEANGGGAHVRLKLAHLFALRLDYDFARQRATNLDSAMLPGDLIPYPDLRATFGLHPLPNRFFSPYLAAGMGINTGTGFGTPVLIAQAGFEITLAKRWVVGAGAQAFYPTPQRVGDFMTQQMERHRRDWAVIDFLLPATYQINAEVTLYL